ncbi:hypothetical protein HDG34_003290 [Paraburkholderia sp. HC6.4b]|uniref:hypothetical protein n=1 Tax=unclassified Paraburkholderia TaxID=2615204 RepID=UPI001620E572|nr:MULTISPECIES: hypothetical protein [unclassified Paraburkholderia]MBB5409349.1 hypothetical protein [Paraburkholderia sp. HC6.4b]MBB5451077.1 hypothetical protein [Paraburkholderia sp. Kb1A]
MSATAGLTARAMGYFPLSVGTSLALEGAFGIHPDHQESPAPILRYDELWCNLKTLLRNCMGALDKTTAGAVFPDELAWTLQEELSQLSELVAEATQNRCRTVYYVSNYAGLAQKYPFATLRTDSTARQKQYAAIQKDTIALMLKTARAQERQEDEQRHDRIAVFDLKLAPATPDPKSSSPKILLLTHYAYDLFSAKRFREMTLLESHTGRLKEKALWHTKYAQGRELTMIPFREDLIQVFGDSELFAPMRLELRRELLQIAQKMQWNPTTTFERIALGVDLMKNPYAREVLKKIISSRY